jgi:hypothetical protein
MIFILFGWQVNWTIIVNSCLPDASDNCHEVQVSRFLEQLIVSFQVCASEHSLPDAEPKRRLSTDLLWTWKNDRSLHLVGIGCSQIVHCTVQAYTVSVSSVAALTCTLQSRVVRHKCRNIFIPCISPVLHSLLFSTSRTLCFLKCLHHTPHYTLLLHFLTCVYDCCLFTCAFTDAVWLSSHGSFLYHHLLRYEFGVYVYIFIHMCCLSFILYCIYFWSMYKTADCRKFGLLWGTSLQ